MLLVVPGCALVSAVVAAAAYRRGLAQGAAVAQEDGNEAGRGAGDLASSFDSTQKGEAEWESVLSVWFDGSTADNHRTKWFAQVEEV